MYPVFLGSMALFKLSISSCVIILSFKQIYQTFHSFPAVNTLFNGLANHPDFDTVNWKNLKVSVGGGSGYSAVGGGYPEVSVGGGYSEATGGGGYDYASYGGY